MCKAVNISISFIPWTLKTFGYIYILLQVLLVMVVVLKVCVVFNIDDLLWVPVPSVF